MNSNDLFGSWFVNGIIGNGLLNYGYDFFWIDGIVVVLLCLKLVLVL